MVRGGNEVMFLPPKGPDPMGMAPTFLVGTMKKTINGCEVTIGADGYIADKNGREEYAAFGKGYRVVKYWQDFNLVESAGRPAAMVYRDGELVAYYRFGKDGVLRSHSPCSDIAHKRQQN